MRENIPAPSKIHVLAIDDDPLIRSLITDYLEDNDIKVTALPDGHELDKVLDQDTVDLLVVDLKLPGEDGLQITRRLRDDSSIPIIMLTGKKDEADRVMGLELGADDYLTKPFSPRELLARIRALLRRARSQETIAEELARVRAFRFSGWELNVKLRRLTNPQGEIISLTNTEFNLLAAFLASPKQILTREQLLTLSRLHNDEVYDRAIDVQVGRLRKKITSPSSKEAFIRTERGSGYMFMANAEVVR